MVGAQTSARRMFNLRHVEFIFALTRPNHNARLPSAFSHLNPKIPFPAAGIETEVRLQLPPNSNLWCAVFWKFCAGAQLIRVESERSELSAPFSRRIAKPLDADAAGQATFYRCFDKIWCEEGE
jgi:hypothetical protein